MVDYLKIEDEHNRMSKVSKEMPNGLMQHKDGAVSKRRRNNLNVP